MAIVGGAEIEVRPNTSSFADDLKSKIGDALKNPLVIAAGAVSAATVAVGAFTKTSVDKFKEVAGSTSQLVAKTGESAQAMSRLSFAADSVGISTDTLAGGLTKLGQTVAKNSEDLTRAGIAFTDAKGKALPLTATLGNVADKFKSMPAGIDKNNLAIQLFGKSGTDLLPILNKGKAGLAELAAQSDKYGLTLSGKNLDALKANKLAHKELNDAMDGLKVQVGAAVMPVMAQLATFVSGSAVPVLITLKDLVAKDLSPVLGTLATDVQTAFVAFTEGFKTNEGFEGNINGIAGIFSSLGTSVHTVFDGVTTAYTSFVDGFKDPSTANTNLTGIQGIFTGFGAIVNGVFNDAVIAYGAFTDGFKSSDAVGAEVGPLATAFAALGVVIRDSLGVLKDIADFAGAHPKMFTDLTVGVLAFVAAYKTIQFGNKTIGLVANGFNEARDIIGDITSGLAKIGNKVISVAVQSTAEKAAGGVASGAGSAVGTDVANVASGAAGGALGNFFDLKELGPKLKNAVKLAFAGIGGFVLEVALPALAGVAEAIASIIFLPEVLIGAAVIGVGALAFAFHDELLKFVVNIPGWVGDGINGLESFRAYLVDKGHELIDGLLNGVQAAFVDVGKFFTDLPANIAYAIGYVGGTLYVIGRDLIGGLLAGVIFAFEEVKSFFIALPGAVLVLLDLIGTLVTKGSDLIVGLQNGIQTAFVDIGDFFINLASAVVGFVGDVGSTLYQKGGDLLTGLKNGVVDFWQDPLGFFQRLPGEVAGAVGDVARTLYTQGQDIIIGLKSGIENLYDSAIGKFRDLRGNVLGAVNDAKSWLIEAGKDVINGLLNGIGQLYGAVLGKMKSLGGDVIKGFKDAVSSKSPSVKMHNEGLNLLQGLANGISAGKQMAVDAITDVAGSMMDPFANGSLGLPAIGSTRTADSGKYTHIENLTISNSKTLQENLDEVDRLALPL